MSDEMHEMSESLYDVLAAEIIRMGFTPETMPVMVNMAGEMIYHRFMNDLKFNMSFWNSVHNKLITNYPFITREDTETILEFILVLVTTEMKNVERQKQMLVITKRFKMTKTRRHATINTTEDKIDD